MYLLKHISIHKLAEYLVHFNSVYTTDSALVNSEHWYWPEPAETTVDVTATDDTSDTSPLRTAPSGQPPRHTWTSPSPTDTDHRLALSPHRVCLVMQNKLRFHTMLCNQSIDQSILNLILKSDMINVVPKSYVECWCLPSMNIIKTIHEMDNTFHESIVLSCTVLRKSSM